MCSVYNNSKHIARIFNIVVSWLSGVYKLQEYTLLTLWIVSIALGQGIEWIRVVLVDIHGLETGASGFWVQKSAVEMWCDAKWWSSSRVDTHPLLTWKRCACWLEHESKALWSAFLSHSLGPIVVMEVSGNSTFLFLGRKEGTSLQKLRDRLSPHKCLMRC